MKICKIIGILVLVFGADVSNANLIDRGIGLIYDDVLNITWLQDANYAKTSGYDNDGRMDWDQAQYWAANLSYQGYDNWRLPDCNIGLNCDRSELQSLYTELISNTDNNLFINIQNNYYWTNSDLLAGFHSAWAINPIYGIRSSYGTRKYENYFTWAVRDGDVATVPIPNTIFFMFSSLLTFICCKRRYISLLTI